LGFGIRRDLPRLLVGWISVVGVDLRLLFVGIEVIEEQVIVFNAVLQMVYHFLLLVYLDSETPSVVEDVLVVIHVHLAA
jgi:hypothetical protein